ncbi:MAG TPA: DUF2399 domain-containing protein, partial [Bacillales bacterium]|nr:DUF2399 domain-containing protein [Bacillales bacterium]
TRGIHAAYDKDANRLEEQLRLICQALAALPKESDYVRLPVFAERVANDPHRFDANTECGAHFLSALQIVRSQENSTYEFTNPLSSEAASELLQSFGIIRDDLLNFVTCTGILGYACENDAAHPVWKEAVSSKTVMNVPLREILPLSFFRPYRGSAVFVVENSGVFSALLDEVSDEASPAMLCTHGQFKIAALLLIDRLVKSGTTIYYSGDLDPEGLQMAQRLVKRHPRHIRLWRYRLQDYLTHASGEVLSSMRLRKLETIEIAALSDVKAEIARLGKPAYQEAFLPALVQDLRFHYSRYG